ncbi:ankyrin repeat domain-containing protein [Paraburkholderia graminis]|uniref:Ankyrin repeat protein n=1 Tax=Paraburkholderia graminis TaxID=60548 RepID=A0ABD5C7V5_9BURK|nr:ankyrin repeat domain-containing protein [Paraburkholderia graminis]MDR6201334.1 ankyrin repeat protein [Paraburkholderia graminis]
MRCTHSLRSSTDSLCRQSEAKAPTPPAYEGSPENVRELLNLLKCSEHIGAIDSDGKTVLHYAASMNVAPHENGDFLDALDAALRTSASLNFNVADRDGNTPLHLAARYQNSREIFEFLVCSAVERNADFSLLNREGLGVIHIVSSIEIAPTAYRKNYAAVLSDSVLDLEVDLRSIDGKTALEMALEVSIDGLNVVRALLRAGADPELSAPKSEAPWQRVAAWRTLYEDALLHEQRSDSAEHLCLKHGDTGRILKLLDGKAALQEAREVRATMTPAIRALGLVVDLDQSMMLNRKLRASVARADGAEALHWKHEGGRLAANLSTRRGHRSMESFFGALLHDRFKLSAALLNDQALSSAPDEQGRTLVFHLARRDEHLEPSSAFLKSAELLFSLTVCDLSVRDRALDTPVHYIAQHIAESDAALMKVVLAQAIEARYDFSTHNGNGQTVLHILAIRSVKPLLDAYLETVGAGGLDDLTAGGRTALDLAFGNDPFYAGSDRDGLEMRSGHAFIHKKEVVETLVAWGAHRAQGAVIASRRELSEAARLPPEKPRERSNWKPVLEEDADDPAFSDEEIRHAARMQEAAAAAQSGQPRRRSLERLMGLVSWFGNVTTKPQRTGN